MRSFHAPIGKLPIGVFTFILLLYLSFIGLDILTTYLASPELRYEYNPVIIYFEMTWWEIVTVSILIAFLIFFCFLFSLSKLINNPQMEYWGFYILGASIFIGHFCYTFFTIVNNILSGVYLGNIDIQWLNSISNWYITELVQIQYFYEIIVSFYFLSSFLILNFAFRKE